MNLLENANSRKNVRTSTLVTALNIEHHVISEAKISITANQEINGLKILENQ